MDAGIAAPAEVRATVTLMHPSGLHARPAAVLVQTAARFASDIRLLWGEREADARSILDVLALGAGQGAEVTVVARGPDAQEAVAALVELVANRFGLS